MSFVLPSGDFFRYISGFYITDSTVAQVVVSSSIRIALFVKYYRLISKLYDKQRSGEYGYVLCGYMIPKIPVLSCLLFVACIGIRFSVCFVHSVPVIGNYALYIWYILVLLDRLLRLVNITRAYRATVSQENVPNVLGPNLRAMALMLLTLSLLYVANDDCLVSSGLWLLFLDFIESNIESAGRYILVGSVKNA